MRRYKIKLITNIALLIILSMVFIIGIIYKSYLLSSFCFILICTFSFILFKYLDYINKSTKRLIDAIRFSEFNISFKHMINNGLELELAESMEKAINIFNDKIQQKESELAFYEILMNRIDFAIIIVAPTNDIAWINKYALSILGKPQPRDLTALESISPDLINIIYTLKPKEIKTIRLTNEHQEYNLVISMVMASIKGKDMRIYSLKDIQPVVDESQNDAWGKIIRVLTHEIMNSLTPIISLSETFSGGNKNDYDKGMTSKALETIHRRSKGLVQFVNSYQQIAYMSVPQFNVFSIEEMMSDITNLMNTQSIALSYDITIQDMTLNADKSQIEQVLINLIKNAYESYPQYEAPLVNITFTYDKYQRVIISVSDNGIGIDSDVLDEIFIPFFTTKKGGSGIGLSMCRQIISAHGGTISVASAVNRGTCFKIRL